MSISKVLVAVLAVMVAPACALAVDGQILINQSTVMAAGGFPYKITQPGSYKLSGNLTVPDFANGIEISANGVSLDLNGFAILGPSDSPYPFLLNYGILGVNIQRTLIANGTISGFPIAVSFSGKSRTIVLEKLRLDTVYSIGNAMSAGTAVDIVPPNAAFVILRDVIALGNVHLTCPSLVIDSIAHPIEYGAPPAYNVSPFPTNCKGENVVDLNFQVF